MSDTAKTILLYVTLCLGGFVAVIALVRHRYRDWGWPRTIGLALLIAAAALLLPSRGRHRWSTGRTRRPSLLHRMGDGIDDSRREDARRRQQAAPAPTPSTP